MIKKSIWKSEVVKNIMFLASGTALSQIVAYLLTPIITRLYTPEESAELGLYIRIISAGAAIATARYELALPVVKLDHHSFRLYHFALKITLYSSLSFLLILLYPLVFSKGISDVVFYLSIPFGIALLAFQNLGANWSLRMKQFRVISFSKVVSSSIGNVLKVLFGLLNTGYIGLILGTVIGFIAGCFFFLRDFRKAKFNYQVRSAAPRNKLIAKYYIEFPKINLPHSLMDMGKELLIAAILWDIFGQREYGLFNHTYQMLRVPLVLIGSSIGQVFFQRCAEKINQGQNIFSEAKKSVLTLLLISIIPFVLVFIFGAEMFAFVFGEEWREAGLYAEIMAPWFMINFVTSPISSLPLILKKQTPFFVFAIFGSLLMVATLFLPSYFANADILQTLWITSIVQTVFHTAAILLILKFTKN